MIRTRIVLSMFHPPFAGASKSRGTFPWLRLRAISRPIVESFKVNVLHGPQARVRITRTLQRRFVPRDIGVVRGVPPRS